MKKILCIVVIMVCIIGFTSYSQAARSGIILTEKINQLDADPGTIETLKSMIEDGIIDQETIDDLIQSEIQKLDEPNRSLLEETQFSSVSVQAGGNYCSNIRIFQNIYALMSLWLINGGGGNLNGCFWNITGATFSLIAWIPLSCGCYPDPIACAYNIYDLIKNLASAATSCH